MRIKYVGLILVLAVACDEGSLSGGNCGDGVCDGDESCDSCAADCGSCSETCGDGTCDSNESCDSCAADCGSCSETCGDGTCDSSESCDSCAADCGSCTGSCGDGTCDQNESCQSCAADCGACTGSCGDGTCDQNESCQSCAADCGACQPICGDGNCDANEDAESCSEDCQGSGCNGAADGTCETTSGENCLSCSADCGSCYFIKAGGDNAKDGKSDANAFASLQTGKSGMADGDDYFFKAGDTWKVTSVYLGRSGTASNRSVYGAYYVKSGKTYLGVGQSNAQPRLKGSDSHATNLGSMPPKYPDWDDSKPVQNPNGEVGNCWGNGDVFNCNLVNFNASYATLQDVEVTNSWGTGIRVPKAETGKPMEHNWILRCKVHHTGAAGISSNGPHTILDGCDVSHPAMHWAFEGSPIWCGLVKNGWPGTVGALGPNSVVRNCRVHDSWVEGICIGDYAVAEFNHVWSTRSVGIYVNGNVGATIKHNLIVGLSNSPYTCPGKEWGGRFWDGGITVRNEPNFFPVPTDDALVMGNVVIGASSGVTISNSLYDGTDATKIDNLRIYNNTFIDNFWNIKLNTDTSSGPCGFKNARIKNNVSYLSAGCTPFGCSQLSRSGKCEAADGWEWGNNLWMSQPTHYAHSSDIIWNGTDPLFNKMSGWVSLTAPFGQYLTTDFFPATASAAKGVGANLGGDYSQLLKQGTDFLSSPISVLLQAQSGSWDVGAMLVP